MHALDGEERLAKFILQILVPTSKIPQPPTNKGFSETHLVSCYSTADNNFIRDGPFTIGQALRADSRQFSATDPTSLIGRAQEMPPSVNAHLPLLRQSGRKERTRWIFTQSNMR